MSLSPDVFAFVTAAFPPMGLLTPMSLDRGIGAGAAGPSVTITAVVAARAGFEVIIATRNVLATGVSVLFDIKLPTSALILCR